MRVEIKEKILKELQNLHSNNSVEYQEQDEFFWHYIVHSEKEKRRVRIYKFFVKYENGFYHFSIQRYNDTICSWEEQGVISVQTEKLDDKRGDYWRDPEPIRPFSLQGLRIKLHEAYTLAGNVHESFYLVSNEIYQTTLDTVSWFEEKQKEKSHESIMAYNMLKLFQAFDVFKKDLNNKNPLIKEIISKSNNQKTPVK